MDAKEIFKKNLKKKRRGMEFSSSPSKLFAELSTEYDTEIESNKVLKFKKNLSETFSEVKQKHLEETADIFAPFNLPIMEDIKPEIITPKVIKEEVFLEPIIENSPAEDLISLATKSISTEELLKPVKEYTDLFNQPNSNLPSNDIKSLQSKLKMLEDWVSKISMSGPGGGEVNFRYLDDVDSNSIGENKYLTYNQDNRNFYFDYVTSNNISNNTRVVTSNTYSLVPDDYYVGINYNGPTTIILQPTAQNGKVIVIKDESGNCSIYPITVNGNVDNDSGGFILKINNGAIQMIYRNGWRII